MNLHLEMDHIENLISRENLAQADILSIAALLDSPPLPESHQYVNFRTRIASRLGLSNPTAARTNCQNGFLLIRAWGAGFWSDVDHVLGQLLLAEITGRIPIIHWGAESLFGGTPNNDSFAFYFNRINNFHLKDIPLESDFFPPKWNYSNLAGPDINKWNGPWSRMNAIYFLNRSEKVIVSDFFTKINQLMHWIPSDHPLSGMSLDEIYQHLVTAYLHPREEFVSGASDLLSAHIGENPCIAVHLRGLDKEKEVNVDDYHQAAFERTHFLIEKFKIPKLLVLTDSTELLSRAKAKFGARVVAVDVTRATGKQGIHFLGFDGRRIGEEIMRESYLAAQSNYFIGLGLSNVSVMITRIANWSNERYDLWGPRQDRRINRFLYDW